MKFLGVELFLAFLLIVALSASTVAAVHP
jgi:hypothetical protein